ncbi:ubiquitin-like-conjugating enzyme ATG10 isoform X6 [Apium graveolens]|uniref:ubiquitin-like-conjugating enzyme ATG10 isoform X6 n=1 Tax=Apium graveolens TaxID=4045 RepID=UPI003D792542
MKIVVRGGCVDELSVDEMELDVWRFRLLETTFLKLANAAFRDDGQPLMLDDIEKDLPANSSKLLTESKWTFITQESALDNLGLRTLVQTVFDMQEVAEPYSRH